MIESAAKDTAQNTKEAAAGAAAATENAAEKVGAAIETADVKSALLADSRVDASHIDVDTNHETKVVTLRGWVPVAGQKPIAEAIAAENAAGYRIDNQLRVGA
jgi:osmotically-inducible protein OsmY